MKPFVESSVTGDLFLSRHHVKYSNVLVCIKSTYNKNKIYRSYIIFLLTRKKNF